MSILVVNKYLCYETDSKIFEAFYKFTWVDDFKKYEIFFYSLNYLPQNFFYLIVLHNLALQ